MYIEPKILKGFRDFLPAAEIRRKTLVEKIENRFRLFGFVPIDTPALEYAEILLGKGGGETEKQIYRFSDSGGRDIALHFDLTVPLARFIALHKAELQFPFKRYHIAKVWRGENTQRGRYREFTQCDFDTIGVDSAESDFEILLLIRDSMKAAGAGEVSIKVNHRGVFNRFLSNLGALEHSVEILRAVDKLAKIGEAEVLKLLLELVDQKAAKQILKFIDIKGDFNSAILQIEKFFEADAKSDAFPELQRLKDIAKFLEDFGTESIADSFLIDTSITRGLDYYTGVVFETFLNKLPEIGSVCSGGRYDNLVGLYTKNENEELSGVGTSIGLDRLITALEEIEGAPNTSTFAKVAIANEDASKNGIAQKIAMQLRDAGIAAEVFVEQTKKISEQFIAAEKKGIKFVIIPGDTFESTFSVRIIEKRQTIDYLTVRQVTEILEETP